MVCIQKSPLLSQSLRGKGKRPLNSEYLVTADLKDGSVMFYRSIFRTLITILSQKSKVYLNMKLSLKNLRMLETVCCMMKKFSQQNISIDRIIDMELM